MESLKKVLVDWLCGFGFLGSFLIFLVGIRNLLESNGDAYLLFESIVILVVAIYGICAGVRLFQPTELEKAYKAGPEALKAYDAYMKLTKKG